MKRVITTMMFLPSRKWIVLWSIWAMRLLRQPTVEMPTKSGLVQGLISADGGYAEYLNVPYGTVTKRFQDSKPVPPWKGVFNAKDEYLRCKQRFSNTLISGEEDCLVLNVYTPLPRPDDVTLKPVMVFIHGGGFRDGSGGPAIYSPEYLVQHGVILVTFNYRLEVLGFLCLGIEEAPGNMGMKDQVLALKWVQENIKTFGGDPDNVTIFGESAGAASVVFQLLSPMSKRLFHKAIMQSGSALSPWAFQYEPLIIASNLAKQMGYETKDPHEIYKILSSLTATELLNIRIPRKKGDVVLSENVFVPCKEKTLENVEPFLTDNPYNLMSKNKYANVPMLIGYNSDEGYMFVGKENTTTIDNFDFYSALPRNLYFPTEQEGKDTAERLKNVYLGSKKMSKDTLLELGRYEGDAGITYSVLATIDMFLKTNSKPIYTYKFCYDGWMNVVKILFTYKIKGIKGATHADELFYIFKTRVTFLNSLFETDMMMKMSTLWSNFAKYGNPTPHQTPVLPNWKATDPQNSRVLVIDKEFSTTPLWEDDIMLYWNKTYSKYRRKV